MNYLEHYGYSRAPFCLGPAISNFYNSAAHASAIRKLTRLLDGEGSAAVVIGEAGLGKTTIAYRLMSQLSPELYGIAFVSGGKGMSFSDIKTIATAQLGSPDSPSLKELCNSTEHETCLLLVDDADQLDTGELNDLVNDAGDFRLILFSSGDISGIDDSALRIGINAISSEGVSKYIASQIRSAGGASGLFSKQLCQKIFEQSGGNPAHINILCQRLLGASSLCGEDTVAEKIMDAVLSAEITVPTASPETLIADAPVSDPIPIDDEITVGLVTTENENLVDGLETDLEDQELEGAVSALEGLEDDATVDIALDPEASDSIDEELDSLLGDLDTENEYLDTDPDPGSIEDISMAPDSEQNELAALAEELDGIDVGDTSAELSDVDDLLAEFEASHDDSESGLELDLDDDVEEEVQAEAVTSDLEDNIGDETDIDALIGDLAIDDDISLEEVVSEEVVSEDDIDIDGLIGDLEIEADPIEESVSDVDADMDDMDVDSLLDDLKIDEEPVAAGGTDSDSADDDLDALLDQLETSEQSKPSVATKTGGDSELDDLLSQIDELQDI